MEQDSLNHQKLNYKNVMQLIHFFTPVKTKPNSLYNNTLEAALCDHFGPDQMITLTFCFYLVSISKWGYEE